MNRKATLPIGLVLLWSLALSGCIIAVGNDALHEEDWQTTQRDNARYIRDLELGVRQSVVEGELGEPAFTEAFTRNGEAFTVLFYRTRHHRSDGETTREETTPLVFVDGALVGWGTSAIDKATGLRLVGS